jgi:hypothetical protein
MSERTFDKSDLVSISPVYDRSFLTFSASREETVIFRLESTADFERMIYTIPAFASLWLNCCSVLANCNANFEEESVNAQEISSD